MLLSSKELAHKYFVDESVKVLKNEPGRVDLNVLRVAKMPNTPQI